VTKSTHLTDD